MKKHTPWFLTALLALLPLAAEAGTLRYDLERGSVRALRFEAEEAPRFEGGPREVAQSFLARFRHLMNGMDRAPGGRDVLSALGAEIDLLALPPQGAAPEAETYRVDRSDEVSFVRMQQTHGGLPVAGAEVVVAVAEGGAVTSFQGGYAARAHEPRPFEIQRAPTLSPEQAMQEARSRLGTGPTLDTRDAQLCWWIDEDGALVKAYEVHLTTRAPLGSWRFYIDAVRGHVLEQEDILLAAGGPAKVYRVNPLRDDNLHEVTLERLDGSGKLRGQWTRVTNGKQDDFQAEDGSYVVDVDSTHFAEVQTYYHIDRAHQALKALDPDTTTMDRAIPVEVHSPGSWQTRWDNAYYDPRRRSLFFLDPQKLNDLHLEPAVAYHEYHHAVTDSIIPSFFGGYGRSLHEGYSDYFACSLTEDPEIGEWALKPLDRPNMRDLRKQAMFPDDMNDNPYNNGELWASTCWNLRKRLGQEVGDFLTHKSRFYLSRSSDFLDAYAGVLAADRDFLDGANQEAIREVFEARGFSDDADESTVEGMRLARFRHLHR